VNQTDNVAKHTMSQTKNSCPLRARAESLNSIPK
jgi:hypothetical protein